MTDHPNTLGGELVACTVRGPVAHLQLNRADKRNAINAQMAAEFEGVTAVLADTSVTVCTLSGAGPLFCAGADLAESIRGADTTPFERIARELTSGRFLWVCGLRGGAAGAGAALALLCPIVVAADDAWVWLPELTRVGALPIAVMRHLAQVIGLRSALNLGVLEHRVDAATALGNGWISEVAPSAEVDERVASLAGKVASAGADSVASASSMWSRRAQIAP